MRALLHWPQGRRTGTQGICRGSGARGSAIAVAAIALTGGLSAAPAQAVVGELGPPPTIPEIQQVVTDFYNVGEPPGTQVDVQFFGPISVGQIVQHDNPDSGSSPMYPVTAQVKVTTKYMTHSVFDPPDIVTVDYYGPPSTGDKPYYFFRDVKGHWQVPAPTCTRCPDHP